MATTSRPIGSKAKLNGKVVVWSGPDYGWQSPATHNKLEKQGKFRIGARELDQIGKFLQPAVQQVQRFQKEFRRQTDKIGGQHLENAVNNAMLQDDILPSSRVAQGAGIVAQNAGNALNLDPRIAGAVPFLLGSVKVGGVDDSVRAARAAQRTRKGRSPSELPPIVAPPHATAPYPPRVDIQPGTPGPRPRRQLPDDSQARISARRAGGRGDPLADGRAAAGADPPSKYQHWQQGGQVAGRDLPVVPSQQGPLKATPGAKAVPVEQRRTKFPEQEKPEDVPRRQRGDRAETRERLQGLHVGPAPGTVPRSRRPRVEVGEPGGRNRGPAPVGRDLPASDRNPWAGKPIGGKPPTREQLVRLRRLEAEGKLDIKPERYIATGNNRATAFDDAPDRRGDRFNDDGGFDAATGDRLDVNERGSSENAGFSVRKSRNSGEGAGQRGATPAIRTAFDLKRLRKDLEKAGVDLAKVDNYKLLSPEDQKRIREQVGAVIRRYPKDSFGNSRPFKSGNSTLNDQVNKFLEEQANPRRFNQIEAVDNGANYSRVDGRRGQILEGGNELPTRGKGVNKDQYENNPGYRARIDTLGTANKGAVEAKRSDNVVGGRHIPETTAEQQRRAGIAQQRDNRKADKLGGDNDKKRHTRGRQRVVASPQQERFVRTDAAWAEQAERLAATRRLNDSNAAIFNALPVTMKDAEKQLRVHHGAGKAEKILNTKIQSIVDANGNDVSITVRDILRERIEEQSRRQGRARGRSRTTKNYESFPPNGARPNTNPGLPEVGDNPTPTTRPTSRAGASRVVRAERRAENRDGSPNLGPTPQSRSGGTFQRTLPIDWPTQQRPPTRSLTRSRGGKEPSTAEKLRAWKAATDAQNSRGSTLEYRGPTFSTAAEAKKAGARVGQVSVDDAKLYNDLKADGEVRTLRTDGYSTKDRYDQLTPDEIKRRAEIEKLRSRARGEKIRRGTKNEAADRARAQKAARELREQLTKQQKELERIRAARARRRSGR